MTKPEPLTARALREYLDEVDRAIERLPPDHAEKALWRTMVAANANWCRGCGDMTDPDDDPSPTLCGMCAIAGRV